MNNRQLWQAVLGSLEISISRGNFVTWFQNTAIVDRTEDSITVSVKNEFFKKWIADKFQAEILKVLKQISPEIKEIKYQVGQARSEQQPVSQQRDHSPENDANPVIAPSRTKDTPATVAGNLNPKYEFETFVIGKHNELAHAASVAVSKSPGSQYNPLFIYGGVGLGKTHLMHAVGNKILHDNPRTKILYVTAEKFTNDYVTAIRQKRMEDFNKTYRSADMLLVDDVQFIAGKEQTQEAFFHIFNELRDKGKQIILTADRLPKEIPAIEQRLVSRFEWGMIADIQAPDLETRLAILQTKATKRGANIPEEILFYIAENVVSNIRELEGALNRLIVFQQMGNVPLTTDRAKQILASMVVAKKKVLSLKKIAVSVAEFYNISMDDLLKQSRKKEYVKPRQIAMYLARKELSSSFPTIGEFFGGRDHTTVMHGVDKIEGVVSSNDSIKQEVDLILDKLYIT